MSFMRKIFLIQNVSFEPVSRRKGWKLAELKTTAEESISNKTIIGIAKLGDRIEQLEAENQKMREALQWYADETPYPMRERAREVLK